MTETMHIKIVSKAEPNAPGEWIEVPIRTQRFQTFDDTTETYADCIPDGFTAVSFCRFEGNKW